MRLHHIGVAVGDLSTAAQHFEGALGYEILSEVIHDPVQTAYCQFLKLPGHPPYLELVAPDGEKSKLAGALKRGGGLNHLCYAVPDIEAACARLASRNMILIQTPLPAVAFPDRRIAWLMDENRLLIELVEEGEDRW